MQSYVFPGNIDESIMQIGAQPFMYMRTDAFSEINKESERILLDLIHCTPVATIKPVSFRGTSIAMYLSE